MSDTDKAWVGVDPGGKGKFGLAILRTDGSVRTWCVNCADEAVALVIDNVNKQPSGVGVDAPMWWSSGPSSNRHADQWIRDKYDLSGGQVQAINSLRGAALAQGMMFVQRLRERFPDVNVTEVHPKAVLSALSLQEDSFYMKYGIETEKKDEDERDAIISAVAAREGFEGRWRNDLSLMRYPSEQDPANYWLAPVQYYWPET